MTVNREGFLLDNVRVLEVAAGWVGPWAGLMLADLGAEVIKVESTRVPDFNRSGASNPTKGASAAFYSNFPDGKLGDKPWNTNSFVNASNSGKYDVTLDLLQPEGLRLFMELAKTSDVFISNMAVGVDEKLGINYEAMRRVNPEIIYATSAGYGRTGPYRARVAMGNTIDAAAGIFGLRDYGDGDSTAVSPDVHCDAVAALTIAFSVVAALYHKKKTGKGVYIDASMVEPAMLHIGEALMDYTINQRVQKSLGNRDAAKSPQGCYPCLGKDQWVTLTIASDEEWQTSADVMGKPEIAGEERFKTALGRLKSHDELDRLIADWTSKLTKFEVMDRLQKSGIAAGAVYDNADVYHDEHIKQRNHMVVVDELDAGTQTYPGRLWKLKETVQPKREHAPLLGEHNEYILKTVLGLKDADVAELKAKHIIGTVPD